MDIKEVLLKLVGKAYNKSADEVSSLLFKKEADGSEVVKDDALDQLLELNKAQVSRLDVENKAHYDKGYKKAEAVVRSQVEKEIKEKFSITDDKQGPELLDAVAAKIESPGTGDLEEDKVKRSKTYLDTVADLKKENARIAKEWEEKFTGREKQLQKEATFNSISDKALKFVESLKPILPADPTKAKNQLDTLIEKLRKEYDYEVKEDGKIVVLKREGDEFKVLVDEHKHPVSFEDMVKAHANSYWDFKQGEERGGTGNNNDNTGSGNDKGYKGPVPKTQEEYLKLIGETKDEATQIAITKAYREGNKNS